jgi:hypothetical protein
VDLGRDPLSLVSTIEDLLGRKSSDSGLENREYGSRDPSRRPCGILYLQKFTQASSTAAVARSVYFARGLRPRSLLFGFCCSVQYTEDRQASQKSRRRAYEGRCMENTTGRDYQ